MGFVCTKKITLAMQAVLPRGSSTPIVPFVPTSRRSCRGWVVSVLDTTRIIHHMHPAWSRSKISLRCMIEATTISNAVATVCALVYGTANPFVHAFKGDKSTRERAAQSTAILIIFYIAVSCIASTSLLYAFFLRGRFLRSSKYREHTSGSLDFAASCWITIRLTWKGALVFVTAPTTVTIGLFGAGLPVLRYNLHTIVAGLFIAIHSVQAISRVVHFRQNETTSATSPQKPSAGILTQRVRPKRTLRHALSLGLLNVGPTLLAVTVGAEFMAVSKSLDRNDSMRVAVFVASSLVVKLLLQLIAKVVALKGNGNTRNAMYRITSLILISEISARTAMIHLAGADNTTSLYAGTVFVGFLEILFRILALTVDYIVIEKRRRSMQKTRDAVVAKHKISRQLKVPSILITQVAPTGVLLKLQKQQAATQVGTEFEVWKATYLRLRAVEIGAETMAEYCGIGFAFVYTISLRTNPVFSLGFNTAPTSLSPHGWMEFITRQFTTLAVQTAAEIVSDFVSSALELRMGIQVNDVFATEELEYDSVSAGHTIRRSHTVRSHCIKPKWVTSHGS